MSDIVEKETEVSLLADETHPSSNPPEFMRMDILPKDFLQDFWEAYDYSNKEYKQRLEESKSGQVQKYFLATVDNPTSRSYEDFVAKGFNPENNIPKKMYTDLMWNCGRRTVDNLKQMVDKNATRGVYTNPIDDGTGNLINPANDTREELSDEVSEGDSDDLKFLKQLRKSIDEFDDKELSVEESVHEKFQKIYDTVERVASNRALKRHAFIYGAPGIGKCEDYNEVIPVRMNNDTAREFEAWLESQKK